MKNILKSHKKLFILLFVVIIGCGIFSFKIYKDSHLSFGVYQKCKDGICEYMMFNKNGKVYAVTQNISNMNDRKNFKNYENLVMKHGIDNLVKKCTSLGYCKDTLNITETNSGNYSLNNGNIKVEWDSNNKDLEYYKVKDGRIWYLDNDLEMTHILYYLIPNYNKWKKCRRNDNCDKVFSIVDPLSNFDYDAVYKNFESNLKSSDCNHMLQYAYKDVTGDGIDEILIRSSVDGKNWYLKQIYYINTWQNGILELGNDGSVAFEDTEISEVYDGGYIYISGKNLHGSYYKTSKDGYLLESYVGDSKYDLPNRKSLYDEINDWKTYPKNEEYCGPDKNVTENNNNSIDNNQISKNEKIYENILTQNRQYLLGLVDTPPEGNIDYGFPNLEDDIKVHLAYTFYDLNHDGKDELIIGQKDSYYNNHYIQVFSIYKYDDEQKVDKVAVGSGNKNNTSINILEDGYFEVEYGWQSIQRHYLYGNIKNDNEVVSDWNDFGEIASRHFYEDADSNWELRLDIYSKGKLVETRKSVTWDVWNKVASKPLSDFVAKKSLNLSSLNWKYILPLD